MSTQLFDLKNAAVSGISLAVQAVRTVSANGTGVDCQPAEGPIFIHYQVGAVTGSPTSLVLTVQESDDNTTFVNITNQSTEGQVDVTAGVVAGFLTLWHRAKRYVRVVATLTGGTNYYLGATVVYRKKISGSGPGNQL